MKEKLIQFWKDLEERRQLIILQREECESLNTSMADVYRRSLAITANAICDIMDDINDILDGELNARREEGEIKP